MSTHPLVGINLPSTELPSTLGGTVNPAKLKGLIVIFCYPWTGKPGVPNPPGWDDIPGAHGSTPQAQAYAQLHDRFVERGAQVFGLSFQESSWQSEFAQRCNLPFQLLSDASRSFSKVLRLETFRAGDEHYLRRITLIARDGAIIAARGKFTDPATDALSVLESVSTHTR